MWDGNDNTQIKNNLDCWDGNYSWDGSPGTPPWSRCPGIPPLSSS